MPPEPIIIELPGEAPITIRHLVLDFTGTLSKDGQLLPGVAERLTQLAQRVRITVLSADTFGTAREALAGLSGVEVQIVATGAAKARRVSQLGAAHVAAIGNGRNDAPVLQMAALSIAVIGPEGAAGDLLGEADVVVTSILDALDLLIHPLRLKATLRD